MKKWKLTLFVAVLLFTFIVLEKKQILNSHVTDYVLSNDDLLILTNWTKEVFQEEEKVTVMAPVADSHIGEYNTMQSFSNGVLLSYDEPLTIYAKHDGFVIFTGHTKSLGKTMTITYDTGERVTYGLLKSLDYLPYTTIKEGEPLATMDSGTFYLQIERRGAMLDPDSIKGWLQ
ncbi:peptidoglycan DD-metalloendopeptidase family protein [Rummeliibacillus suwonensis]|uniref:peptidoglycan DD-metalloendopeptidase family protein n=1 Tax=Rummeliibacillus suwonensis TaxID=1306154 RepID=UPI0011B4BA4B|nr:peptidoglycan DD-metalloendopeptidase family protein [Rummeliibacillus suwonensis]MBO2534821.1 peptidoglycan DD-metalloendopeptidase family protein [Rummeliibacillus suwonensis]